MYFLYETCNVLHLFKSSFLYELGILRSGLVILQLVVNYVMEIGVWVSNCTGRLGFFTLGVRKRWFVDT